MSKSFQIFEKARGTTIDKVLHVQIKTMSLFEKQAVEIRKLCAEIANSFSGSMSPRASPQVNVVSISVMGSETDFECGEIEVENRREKIAVKDLKKHVCPYDGCSSSFNRPWKLNRHINTHTKQRPFKCDYPGCTKDYMNKSHLDRHKCVTHSRNKPLPVHIPCPYPDCNKFFMNKWSLKKHCNVHKNKDSYNCSQCSSSFKKSRQLRHHLYLHSGIKPFACDTCEECFATQTELKFHNKKHKVYTCEYQECQQQFNTWNAVRKHMKIFHVTFYKCDSCGKTFKNKWTLTEHVFSHLPDNDREVFECPHTNCERFYFHQRNLEHHLKSFHQNINHKCQSCGQTFVKKTTLKKHERLEHKGYKVEKEPRTKEKQIRKPRTDKGRPRKSMAALLSGIILPYHIDKNLAQNNITSEVLESIQQVRSALLGENIFQLDKGVVKPETQNPS